MTTPITHSDPLGRTFPKYPLLLFALVIGMLQRLFQFLPDPNPAVMAVVTLGLAAMLAAVAALTAAMGVALTATPNPAAFKPAFNAAFGRLLLLTSALLLVLSLMGLGNAAAE